MDIVKSGLFIAELRKKKMMTQKELAELLHVTDKAVSKWERGIASPDVQLLPKMSQIFNVSINEILRGECEETFLVNNIPNQTQSPPLIEDSTKNKKKYYNYNHIISIICSILFITAILVCTICDVAINKRFTWSLYPISSIVFTWLVTFPTITFGKKGILYSLIILSISIFPFLLILNILIDKTIPVFLIGSIMSVISLVLIWAMYFIFKYLHNKLYLAFAIATASLIPTYFIIEIALHFLINEPLIDIWDILSLSILVIISVVLFVVDYFRRKAK